MAHKQTRRSISVSLSTYARIKDYCEANNTSMSGFTERTINDFLNQLPPSMLQKKAA